MTAHLQHELESLKKSLLSLSAQVEKIVRQATKAFTEGDTQQATEVIESDRTVDAQEVVLEEECLKILALHQPVAIDLRFIIAVLKINNDLERIGDLAVNIAEAAARRTDQSPLPEGFDLVPVADRAQKMLALSMDSLVNMDTKVAREVCAADDEVDAEKRRISRLVVATIKEDPTNLDLLIQILLVARHIERIADLATNIAEDTIYMVDGDIVRHHDEPSD